MNVLVVEDDSSVRRVIVDQLTNLAIDVTTAADLAAGRAQLAARHFDVVVLDLTLPDGSGLDLLDGLRAGRSKTHVIVLSGAAAERDRVGALYKGADDYVTKPFYVRELAARVLAVKRRAERDRQTTLEFGPIRIDLSGRRVSISGTDVALTTMEFDLLAFLASNPNQVFSREELLHAVWNSTSAWQQPRTVTEHVRRIRAKLGAQTAVTLFVSIRGVGYRFDPPQPSAIVAA